MDLSLNKQLMDFNNGLSKCTLRLKAGKFYVKAMCPDKNNLQKKKQYDIATRLNGNLRYFKQATAIALEIDSDLVLERWDWSKWIRKNVQLTESVKYWAVKFEDNYWVVNEKTLSRADNFRQDYLLPFQSLPQHEPLTTDLVIKFLSEIPPNSRKRVRYYNAFRCLLNFAQVTPELPKNLKGKYKPTTDRDLVSDEEIIKYWQQIPHPEWRWVYGILATYGLRPHELFHLDLSRLSEDVPILEVLKPTKTRDRLVYPLPAEWVTDFGLTNVIIPNWNCEGKSNKQLGAIISSWFNNNRAYVPITAYYLRDAYAVRGVRHGIESSVVARWMGHGLRIHHDHYGKYINEKAFTEIWHKSQTS